MTDQSRIDPPQLQLTQHTPMMQQYLVPDRKVGFLVARHYGTYDGDAMIC